MKKKIILIFNAFLASILAFFGCDKYNNAIEEAECEYGCRIPQCVIDGTVVNEQNTTIGGAQVIAESDTTYTSEDGTFLLNLNYFIDMTDSVQVTVNDVDGEANGNYETTSVKVRPTDSPVQIVLKEKNKK